MTIYLNKREVEVTSRTIWELLEEQNIKPEGIAVAIDNRIVKREEWPSTELAAASKVTIIQATYGG